MGEGHKLTGKKGMSLTGQCNDLNRMDEGDTGR